ncbi:MAG: quinohemoprotein amine dehydrogenase subunit alpha [Emcibacter sp.]|nr:quinohemoprotein amine dehydrogenase subunit alpha [Emcibacter sp.]
MTLKNALFMPFILFLCFYLSACSQDDKKSMAEPNVTDTEIQAGRMLISDNCSGCHMEMEDHTFSRISQIRKTPEGWDMNIARMMIFHGLEISSEDRKALVKFLSDTQGLAPSETLAHRDVLERKHNIIEQGTDPDLASMCARCHTYARVALQRRDKTEWQNLVHMHLGQWASIEYQMLSRERDWRADALGSVAEKLGQMYPLKTAAWDEWQNTEWKDMSGEWRIVGHEDGRGDFNGTMRITTTGNDTYKVEYDLVSPEGTSVTGMGKSIVHSGYEWRGASELQGQKYREIWAASKDGNSMTGRFFQKDHSERGGNIIAWRKSDTKGIMTIVPSSLKAGVETEITINGVDLSGDVSIEGAKVTVKSATADRVTLTATADGTPEGQVKITVGNDVSTLALYTEVDYLKVTPEYGISRVGGGGGVIPKVHAQFEATGYSVGPDGVQGTQDDINLGSVPVTWSVDNYNEAAAAMDDAKYAGEITSSGTFIPAEAGPNKMRKYSTNNAGDLKVIATYTDGDRNLTAEAHLIATVQRWNNPPIM